MNMRPFRRVTDRAWLGGVAAGLAYAWGLPTWLVRLVWALCVCCLGTGALIYLLLWLFVPEWETAPEDYATVAHDPGH
jgi:phage shock protein C